MWMTLKINEGCLTIYRHDAFYYSKDYIGYFMLASEPTYAGVFFKVSLVLVM